MIATNDGSALIICIGDDTEKRAKLMRLAAKQIKQSIFVFADQTKIADAKEKIAELIKTIKASGYHEMAANLDVKMFDDVEIYEHVFNSAVLVSRKSQTHRRAFKGVSGCPPMNRGRHFDRKLKKL